MNKFSTCSHQEEIKPVHMAKGPSMTGLPRVEMKSTWLMSYHGKREKKKNTSKVEKDISMFKKPDGPTHPSTGRISGPVCSIKEPAVGPVTQWNRTIPRQFKLTPLFCKHGRAPLDLMFWAKAHCWAIFYL